MKRAYGKIFASILLSASTWTATTYAADTFPVPRVEAPSTTTETEAFAANRLEKSAQNTLTSGQTDLDVEKADDISKADSIETATIEKTIIVPEPDPREGGFSVSPSRNFVLARTIEKRVTRFSKKGDRLFRRDQAALAEFYAERDFAPIWIEDGRFSKRAHALSDRLSRAFEDGLTPGDYTTVLPHPKADIATLAMAETELSKALLHYARDAQAGRIDPASVSQTIKLKRIFPDPVSVMNTLNESDNPEKALAAYNPPHPEFQALKAELAALRAIDSSKIVDKIIVPSGETMYEGYQDPRVEILRERLNVPAIADENPQYFGKALKAAVRGFQRENGLIADGLVGPKTLRTINGGERNINRIPDIIANMERWRWMDRDMGNLHLVANIPSFEVSIKKNNKTIHKTRVIVGKTKHKTPVFSDEMEFVVVNPYWNVPYSIASKELLPRIRKNPSYVNSRNYEVLRGNRVINPTRVNWDAGSFRKYRIRQKPGSRNALGDVKFLFPNKYSIYFHDTPSKSLFRRVSRAFSHGCVRIHNPFEFGDVLMEQIKGWNNGRLASLKGNEEHWIRLKEEERVPVHLTYFTAIADETGKVTYKSDIYGHNSKMKRLLGLI